MCSFHSDGDDNLATEVLVTPTLTGSNERTEGLVQYSESERGEDRSSVVSPETLH